MELRQYAAIVLRWWWLILLGTILAGVTAFVVSTLQQPVYEASVTLLVDEAAANKTSDYNAILTSERLARTYVQMFTTRTILDEVILRLKLHTTSEILAKQIDAQIIRDTQLIALKVEDTDPALAASIANTLPDVFIAYNQTQQSARFADTKASLQAEISTLEEQISRLENQIAALGEIGADDVRGQLQRDQLDNALAGARQSRTALVQSFEALRLTESQSTSNVTVVEAALTPRDPIRPRTAVNTLLAAVVGLMLAVGIAFLIEYLDDTVKSPDDIAASLQLPTVGVVRKLSHKEMGEGVVAITQPRSPYAEAFRGLRTNIQFSSVDKPMRTLLVTSSGPAEGKSTIAANLAAVLAQTGLKVVLVDGDLRRPAVHHLFGKPNRFGLTELMLTADLHLEQAYQATNLDNLVVMSSGRLPPNPAELLASERMVKILANLSARADVVVIDSPPISAVTDAVVLASRVDGVLLVVETGVSRLTAVAHAVEQLRRVGATVIGAVLNKVESRRSGYYYNSYNYYAYDSDRSDGRRPARATPVPTQVPETPASKPQA